MKNLRQGWGLCMLLMLLLGFFLSYIEVLELEEILFKGVLRADVELR